MSTSRPTLPSPHREIDASSQSNESDPQLPALLEIERNPKNPDRLEIRIIPSVEGNARLVTQTVTGLKHGTSRTIDEMDLRKANSTHAYVIDLLPLKRAATDTNEILRVSLEIYDDQGIRMLTTDREVALTTSTIPAKSTTVEMGTTAAKEPVEIHTPSDVPAPRLGHAALGNVAP